MMLFGSSLRSLVLPAIGSLTSTPFCSIGVITMKMISSTIMMSAIGVTLMSAIAPPLFSPTAIDIGRLLGALRAACGLSALLDEVVEQLRARVVHLDVESLDLVVEVVVGPDGGDGHEQSERGGDH